MTQEQKELLLQDLCARLPYGVIVNVKGFDYDYNSKLTQIYNGVGCSIQVTTNMPYDIEQVKPYLFPLSSMTDEDYTIYSKIWEDTGKTAYLEGCHHLISTIKAYQVANDYLLSKHYDINGLIPMGIANDATGLNIY